jgi:F0F1-type ATP synthase epsilon subunit
MRQDASTGEMVDDGKTTEVAVAANGKPTMQIKVYSPFKVYFDGAAYSITGLNATGPFDILPHHHNFISLLNACELVVQSVDDGENKIKIAGGIMHVKADKVSVFLQV